MKEESHKKFSSDEAREEYYRFEDRKTKREHLDKKYDIDKDDLNVVITDNDIKKYFKDYSDFLDINYTDTLHNIIKEHQEIKLLIQYDNAELSTGQIAEKLEISKSEVLDLLVKHKIPYVRVYEEYLEQEFKTIEKYIK